MQFSDLGPLEQALLAAVLRAEAGGLALPASLLWRMLPRYSAPLANLEAALQEGGPLRSWLHEVDGLLTCVDQQALAHGMAAGRRRAAARWEQLAPTVRGLCKLPFVEAVAVTGSLAWGCLPDVEEPCSLVLIAEGGRVASAQGSAALYCKARGARGAELQVLKVLDADSLDFPEPGLDVGLAVASLRPVTNSEAWAELHEANPWLAEQYPNWDSWALELPDYRLADRLDGRLASLRRGLMSGEPLGAPLVRSGSRRPGPLARLEGVLSVRFGPGELEAEDGILPPGHAEAFEERWSELKTWEIEAPGPPEPPRSEAAAPPLELAPDSDQGSEEAEPSGPEASTDAPSEPAVESTPEDAAPSESEDSDSVLTGSRRQRGSERRPSRRRRSAASPQTGQRSGRRDRSKGRNRREK